jgi:hypothetical protein
MLSKISCCLFIIFYSKPNKVAFIETLENGTIREGDFGPSYNGAGCDVVFVSPSSKSSL